MLAGCAAGAVRVDPVARVVHAQTLTLRPLSYRFGPVPSTWDRIEIPGNDVAWHDRTSDGVIHVDHACAADQDVPLASLVQHLLIGFTDREFTTEETVPFDAREARHVTGHARLDGVSTMFELYVMKKDGCVYDLGYVALPARFALGASAFAEFVHGFATVNTGVAERTPGAPR